MRPRQVTDQQILDAARAVFLEHGPAASTQLIADRLSVSPAALFKRFGSKEELLCAALAPAYPAWADQMDMGPGDGDAKAELRELGLQMASFFEALMPCVAMLTAAGISVERMLRRDGHVPPPVRARMALTGWIARAQRQGKIRSGDPTTMALAFLGALNTRAMMLHLGGASEALDSAADYIDALLDTLWHGFAPVAEETDSMRSAASLRRDDGKGHA